MKTFVTGATGLLGSNLVRALRAEGHSVRALVRSKEKAVGRAHQGDSGVAATSTRRPLGNIASSAARSNLRFRVRR